ncbi:four-carbon acid sugar kinase family protein [uncultured Nocardioides sp.]|uniref:four-carbon acid sugar kinase family protein n=1 Tax=uncultured Nocardioides sp. TaxID=198441 RepID=UPI00261D3A4B|nr:four-carbon acid sugar kinase family protein [uncultured Nocardioides sp.]
MSDAHPRVLVVADDLTGANDCGVQFAAAGWPSTLRMRVDRDAAPVPGTVAVSTDSRALDDDAAAAVTRDAVAAEELAAGDHVYLKVDSTLRGSVAGQLRGALTARRRTRPDAFVVLCPAYPAMGRRVEGGLLTVHGEPVTASPAGRDPVTPVRHDLVTDLVGGSVPVPAPSGEDPTATAAVWGATGADVLVVDAADDADLARVAAVLVALGPRAVPAGSAGLAAPLARLWGGDGEATPPPAGVRRPLVLVSSHHATARQQVDALVAGRPDVTRVATAAEELLGDAPLPAAPDGDGPVVLVSPDERTEPHRSAALAAALGRRTAAWAGDARHRVDAIVLVGGDGAEATLRAASADGLRIHGRLLEGVPYGEVAGGDLDGLPVVTKAGGFGDDTTLLTLLDTLMTDDTTENAS